MSLGAWLVVAVVVAWLLFHPVGRAALTGLFLAACVLILVACERQIELECNVSRVSGVFTTTQKELENPRGGHVLMARNGRSYYWPADRVTACREIE